LSRTAACVAVMALAPSTSSACPLEPMQHEQHCAWDGQCHGQSGNALAGPGVCQHRAWRHVHGCARAARCFQPVPASELLGGGCGACCAFIARQGRAPFAAAAVHARACTPDASVRGDDAQLPLLAIAQGFTGLHAACKQPPPTVLCKSLRGSDRSHQDIIKNPSQLASCIACMPGLTDCMSAWLPGQHWCQPD
jgi:hypothetical protein